MARALLADRLFVAFASADELGRRAGVDSATVVRFAQRLGYRGWVELREAVRAQVPALLTAADKLSRAGDDATGPHARQEQVLEHDLRNIRETAILNSGDTIEAAVKAIAGARQVFVVGVGLETAVADLLALQLKRSGVSVRRIDRNLATSALDLVEAGGPDVVLGIAIWRYTRDCVRMFEEACRLGASGIALTDSLVSPLTPQADLVLLAADSSPRLSHSLTGMLSLVNVIADGVGSASPPQAVETLRRLDGMFDDFDAIYG